MLCLLPAIERRCNGCSRTFAPPMCWSAVQYIACQLPAVPDRTSQQIAVLRTKVVLQRYPKQSWPSMAKRVGSGGGPHGAEGSKPGHGIGGSRVSSNGAGRGSVVIVGAGPAGCVMSMYLAKQVQLAARIASNTSLPSST